MIAAGGYASTYLSDLFYWASLAVGGGVLGSLPLFDGGLSDACIQSAGAEFDVALERYREQVLVAFKDVEDQLAARALLEEQAEAQERAVASASRSTALPEVRYRNGYLSHLALLDPHRTALPNRRQ